MFLNLYYTYDKTSVTMPITRRLKHETNNNYPITTHQHRETRRHKHMISIARKGDESNLGVNE